MASEATAAATARVEPGTRIGGFEVVDRLHSGGAGYIYKVRPRAGEDPGFPLVMKVPAVGPGEPVIGLVGFEMELMIQPALRGRHVPRFVAAGDLHTTPYLVMEYVEGQSLAAIRRRAPLHELELANLGAAIADALESLHEQDTVHQDLKPENIMVRADGTAVLLDFGFAHHAAYPDLLGEEKQYEAGSAGYVSPEQLRQRRGDPRSDLFALGAILYELATGELPFGLPLSLAGMRDRLWKAPAPPRSLAPTLSPAMQEVILRCLEVDAADRYPTAALLAFDLRHLGQVAVSRRGEATEGVGFWRQAKAWWRSREVAETGEAPARAAPAPVILVAVDTTHMEDPRHPAIQRIARMVMSVANEHRVMCVSVIRSAPVGEGPNLVDTESGRHLEHLARLKRFVEPLGLPANRVSLHVIESIDPSSSIVSLAKRNHADLVVLGAPSPTEKVLGWWRSVASGVTANAPCSVYVVRVKASDEEAA